MSQTPTSLPSTPNGTLLVTTHGERNGAFLVHGRTKTHTQTLLLSATVGEFQAGIENDHSNLFGRPIAYSGDGAELRILHAQKSLPYAEKLGVTELYASTILPDRQDAALTICQSTPHFLPVRGSLNLKADEAIASGVIQVRAPMPHIIFGRNHLPKSRIALTYPAYPSRGNDMAGYLAWLMEFMVLRAVVSVFGVVVFRLSQRGIKLPKEKIHRAVAIILRLEDEERADMVGHFYDFPKISNIVQELSKTTGQVKSIVDAAHGTLGKISKQEQVYTKFVKECEELDINVAEAFALTNNMLGESKAAPTAKPSRDERETLGQIDMVTDAILQSGD